MPKNRAKNITDRIALFDPITSTRLLGMMLTKASMPDACSVPVLTIALARPADCSSSVAAAARSTPAPGCSRFTAARLTATAIDDTMTV